MYVRLAFATAIHVDPEILIVDEALAVGDAIFANRCIKKFEELKERKVTVLFVSHDLGLVKRLSDRAALMVDGRVAAYGLAKRSGESLCGAGARTAAARTAGSWTTQRLASSHRHGDGASRVLSVDLWMRTARRTRNLEPGEPVTIRVRARAERELEDPVVGVLIRNRLGIDVFGTNTRIEGRRSGTRGGGRDVRSRVHVRLPADPPRLYTDRCHAISRTGSARIGWMM